MRKIIEEEIHLNAKGRCLLDNKKNSLLFLTTVDLSHCLLFTIALNSHYRLKVPHFRQDFVDVASWLVFSLHLNQLVKAIYIVNFMKVCFI